MLFWAQLLGFKVQSFMMETTRLVVPRMGVQSRGMVREEQNLDFPKPFSPHREAHLVNPKHRNPTTWTPN